MSENNKRKLVVSICSGPENEKSTIGFTIANGAMTAGMEVSVFLSSNGVDLIRKRSAHCTQVHPFEPLQNLINDFISRGGTVWACSPCVKSRGYEENDVIDGVTVCGASGMLELIATGAGTLSF